MKKLIQAILFLMLGMVLVACGNSETVETGEADGSNGEVLRL